MGTKWNEHEALEVYARAPRGAMGYDQTQLRQVDLGHQQARRSRPPDRDALPDPQRSGLQAGAHQLGGLRLPVMDGRQLEGSPSAASRIPCTVRILDATCSTTVCRRLGRSADASANVPTRGSGEPGARPGLRCARTLRSVARRRRRSSAWALYRATSRRSDAPPRRHGGILEREAQRAHQLPWTTIGRQATIVRPAEARPARCG